MANENGNLVKEFEESFQKCLTSLTEEDDLYSREPESTDRDIEEKLTQFTDVARCVIPDHLMIDHHGLHLENWRPIFSKRDSQSTITSLKWCCRGIAES